MADVPTPVGLPVFAEPMQGDLVGRYRVESLLGEGGMARVYELEHLDHKHKAALKLPKLGLDEQFRDRFLLEAGAHLNLNGKLHIVNPLETGTMPAPDSRPYLIMQLVEGKTLEAFMRDVPQAPSREAADARLFRSIRFMIQTAIALENAHSLRPPIVHRDLKPSNVYVTNAMVQIEGREVEYVLLGDFGLAWRRGDELSAVGTPDYCSPEQAANERPTTRSDFYSLGVMLFELIEGRLPFEHHDTRQLLAMHRSTTPPLLTNPLGREYFQPLVSKLLAKQPEQRPPDAGEIIRALSGALRRAEQRDTGTAIGRVPDLGVPPTARLHAPAAVAPERPSANSAVGSIPEPRQPAFARGLRWLALGLTVVFVGVAAAKLAPSGSRPPLPAMVDTQPPRTAVPLKPVPVAPARDEAVPVEDLAPLRTVAIEPKVAEPKVAEPKVAESKVVEPKVAEPKVVEPKVVEPKVVEPKVVAPRVNEPTVVCEPSPEWKKLMMGTLAALEAQANALPALQLTTEAESVGRAVAEAQTSKDCARAIKQFEALRKRAIK